MKYKQLLLAALFALAGVQTDAQTGEKVWVDASQYINNPGLQGNSTAGWTIKANASSRTTNYEIQEFWNGTFDFYQKIRNIPNGHYRVSVYAFQRPADIDDWHIENWQEEDAPALLYANDESVQVKSLYSDWLDLPLSGCYSYYNPELDREIYFANQMYSAMRCLWWNNMYRNVLEVDVTDGNLTIGITNSDFTPSNWCAFTHWQLEREVSFNEAYATRQQLNKKLTEAKKVGVSVPEAEEIYANYKNYTSDDIAAAIKAVTTAVADALFAQADEDHPQDVSTLIVNPSFDLGNTYGWDFSFEKGVNASNAGYQSSSYRNGSASVSKFFEAWVCDTKFYNSECYIRALGDGYICQTIKDLPAGTYDLCMDCIATNQDGVWAEGVEFYYENAEEFTCLSIGTENETPEHFVLDFVHPGGDLTIGVRTECTTANWLAVDNFKLICYGIDKTEPQPVTDCDLTAEMFCRWDGYTAGANVVSTDAGEYHFGESCVLPYGNGNVEGSTYADLTPWRVLALTVTQGAPLLLFNRQDMNCNGPLIEVDGVNSPYVIGVKDGVWYIDLAKITDEAGYAHLNCIMGANWSNATIVSARLLTEDVDIAVGIDALAKAQQHSGALYDLSGRRVGKAQKGGLYITNGKVVMK